MKQFIFSTSFLISLFLLTSTQPLQEYYAENLRPQYHFSPEKNFIGNPAGLIFYEGEYHLFYQYNPKGMEETGLNLGHAVSNDLVHWKHLPVAVAPDAVPGDTICNSILSGCVVVDQDNVLGFQQGENKTFVMFYTGNQCGQRMAYSNDKGKTWQKYRNNPVIPYDKNDDARYPRVFWNKPSGKWIMALYRKPDNDNRKRGFSFFTSDNLINWEYQSHLAGFSENPDLIELRVNNRSDDTRWVVIEGNGNYLLGSFDGKKFTAESIRMKVDFGSSFIAPQTWNNIPAADGRTIQIAGLKDGQWSEMPFKGQLTFPVELALKKVNTGIFLTRQPVKEIESIYGKQNNWKNVNLIPGLNQNLIKKIQGNCFRIKGRFDLKNCDSFGMMLKAGRKNPGTELMYNVKRQALTLMGETIPLAPVDNKIILDILVDRASVEVFANNGLTGISVLLPDQENNKDFVLFNNGGELLVEELNICEINSVWTAHK
jgi:fructan beta-fructosidase